MKRQRRFRLLPGAGFDYDKTRFCIPLGEEMACYRGGRDENGEWKGTLEGIARDADQARRFLDGASVQLR